MNKLPVTKEALRFTIVKTIIGSPRKRKEVNTALWLSTRSDDDYIDAIMRSITKMNNNVKIEKIILIEI
jgi:hypothetical protein